MTRKLPHLEMIQAVINRMNQNSFMLKGWSVVLISALFALAASGSNTGFVYLAYFPAIVFWVLDAYFLWQEKLFRALYDHVRALDEETIDFAMDTSNFKASTDSWTEVMFSKTLLLFHGTVIASIIIVMMVLIRQNSGGQ